LTTKGFILRIRTDYNEKLNAKEIEGNVLLCTILVLSRQEMVFYSFAFLLFIKPDNV
jgi:hypothetical protein